MGSHSRWLHKPVFEFSISFLFIYFFKFYFIFKLYIIVLVLPNIKMNPPQVYMCLAFLTFIPQRTRVITSWLPLFSSPLLAQSSSGWSFHSGYWPVRLHMSGSYFLLGLALGKFLRPSPTAPPPCAPPRPNPVFWLFQEHTRLVSTTTFFICLFLAVLGLHCC